MRILQSGKLLGDSFKFQDSKEKLGLQLADVFANAMPRAFNGRLGETGWKHIGSLIVALEMNYLSDLWCWSRSLGWKAAEAYQ